MENSELFIEKGCFCSCFCHSCDIKAIIAQSIGYILLSNDIYIQKDGKTFFTPEKLTNPKKLTYP